MGGAGVLSASASSVMAAAPILAVAIVGAALAGVGNGVESVAVRTALQEQVERAVDGADDEPLRGAVPVRPRGRHPDRRRDHGALGARARRSRWPAPESLAITVGGLVRCSRHPGAAADPQADARPSRRAASDREAEPRRPRRDATRAGSATSVECARGAAPPDLSPRRRPAPDRAPCLHRHRLEHDAAARRGLRRRAAGRGPPGEGLHPRAAGTDRQARRSRPRRSPRWSPSSRASSRRRATLGAADVRGVATAAVRQAANRDALVSRSARIVRARVRRSCPPRRRRGWPSAAPPARSATCRPDRWAWSTSVAVRASSSSGRSPDRVDWFASFPLGSGDLADECLRSDPPSADGARPSRGAGAAQVLDGVQPPPRGRTRSPSAAARRRCAGSPVRCSTRPRSSACWRCWRPSAAGRRGAALRARRRPGPAAPGGAADPAGQPRSGSGAARDRPRRAARGRAAGGGRCLARIPPIPPREALADVRVRAPTRGNRRLELLLDAVNAERPRQGAVARLGGQRDRGGSA